MAYDDQSAIGKPQIMRVYLDIINNFGTYQTHNLRENFKLNLISIEYWKYCLTTHWHSFKYSNVQLYESLYQYCDANNLDIDTTIKYAKFGHIKKYISLEYIERQNKND
jgi:hypothetical protein